jgi:hypothetical protein
MWGELGTKVPVVHADKNAFVLAQMQEMACGAGSRQTCDPLITSLLQYGGKRSGIADRMVNRSPRSRV